MTIKICLQPKSRKILISRFHHLSSFPIHSQRPSSDEYELYPRSFPYANAFHGSSESEIYEVKLSILAQWFMGERWFSSESMVPGGEYDPSKDNYMCRLLYQIWGEWLIRNCRKDRYVCLDIEDDFISVKDLPKGQTEFSGYELL